MRLALLAFLVTVAGCSSSPSEECKQVCRREAECADEMNDPNLKIDQDECTTVCTALQRDPEGRQIVDEHVACVAAAGSCEDVLACSR